jgi:hypothetical protein
VTTWRTDQNEYQLTQSEKAVPIMDEDVREDFINLYHVAPIAVTVAALIVLGWFMGWYRGRK